MQKLSHRCRSLTEDAQCWAIKVPAECMPDADGCATFFELKRWLTIIPVCMVAQVFRVYSTSDVRHTILLLGKPDGEEIIREGGTRCDVVYSTDVRDVEFWHIDIPIRLPPMYRWKAEGLLRDVDHYLTMVGEVYPTQRFQTQEEAVEAYGTPLPDGMKYDNFNRAVQLCLTTTLTVVPACKLAGMITVVNCVKSWDIKPTLVIVGRTQEIVVNREGADFFVKYDPWATPTNTSDAIYGYKTVPIRMPSFLIGAAVATQPQDYERPFSECLEQAPPAQVVTEPFLDLSDMLNDTNNSKEPEDAMSPSEIFQGSLSSSGVENQPQGSFRGYGVQKQPRQPQCGWCRGPLDIMSFGVLAPCRHALCLMCVNKLMHPVPTAPCPVCKKVCKLADVMVPDLA